MYRRQLEWVELQMVFDYKHVNQTSMHCYYRRIERPRSELDAVKTATNGLIPWEDGTGFGMYSTSLRMRVSKYC